MSKPSIRRVIRRAARFAIASGGICLVLSLTATQADAARGSEPPVLSGLTTVVGSLVNTVTEPVTSVVPAVAQALAPTDQATPTPSASGASRSSTSSGRQ